tara:strand:+ start:475 stop:948 length:474 start_codon:yes stop_codon:yes gene_type:complete
MKVLLLSLILLLTSCAFFDYFEVHVGASQGHGDFNRSFGGVDEETAYLGFTLGANLGTTNRAMKNMAALDVSPGGELTLREDLRPAAPVTVVVGADKDPTHDDHPAPVDPPFWKQIRIPKTLNEALLLGMFAMILVGSIILLKRAGVKLPFLSSKKD